MPSPTELNLIAQLIALLTLFITIVFLVAG
jgi:hypothetical protein